MEKSNIYSFLKFGVFNELEIGMDINIVKQITKGNFTLLFSSDISSGFDFNSVQILFYEGTLQSIIIAGSELRKFNIMSGEKDFSLGRNYSFEKILKALYLLNIEWEFRNDTKEKKSLSILTEGGVNILIDFSEGYSIVDRLVK